MSKEANDVEAAAARPGKPKLWTRWVNAWPAPRIRPRIETPAIPVLADIRGRQPNAGRHSPCRSPQPILRYIL
jgi:hypothetical protein